MQVRVFESKDMASGLRQVRKELGPDALILSTRTVRNGKLGLLGKPTIEITAAIDSKWPENDTAKAAAAKPYAAQSHKPHQSTPKTSIDTTVGGNDFTPDYSPPREHKQASELRQILNSAQADNPRSNSGLRSEVDELKSLVRQLAGQVFDLHATSDTSPESEGNPKLALANSLHKRLAAASIQDHPSLTMLTACGVNRKIAGSIADYINSNERPEDGDNSEQLEESLRQALADLIEVQPPEFRRSTGQLRLALMGPTGVGKTTTLAKLAAQHLRKHSNSIALITIDTYRIAAVEQLKVYGEIMRLPVDVVISPEQLKASLTRHRYKELILIDTAGISPRDALSVSELSSFLKPEFNIEKHLVLSAVTRERVLLDTVKHFREVGIDRIIFTKVDECKPNGVIVNVQAENSAPLSYITNGQRVPEDLMQITPQTVAELIMSSHEGIAHD